jgi:hypothetical protein
LTKVVLNDSFVFNLDRVTPDMFPFLEEISLEGHMITKAEAAALKRLPLLRKVSYNNCECRADVEAIANKAA